VYVSFSGGKDSTVLLDITKRLFPDVPAVFCDTGLEYPEVRELALRKADVVIRPKMTFRKVIEKYGYPIPGKEQALYIRQARNTKSEHMRSIRLGNGRYSVSARWRPLVYAPFEVSEKCCDVIKKAPFKQYAKETGRARMTAMIAYESSRRERSYMLYGCNNFSDKNPSSAPMAIWTEQDVLRYIKESGIEYASCYGEIVETRGGGCSDARGRTGLAACSACSASTTMRPRTAFNAWSATTRSNTTTASTSWESGKSSTTWESTTDTSRHYSKGNEMNTKPNEVVEQ